MGEYIRKRRMDLGLTQLGAAQRVGALKDTLRYWEKGYEPSARYWPGILRFLGYDPYPAPRSLGENLVAKRRQLGLSRKRMAARLGVDEGTMKRWERGMARPTGKRIETVNEFLASDT